MPKTRLEKKKKKQVQTGQDQNTDHKVEFERSLVENRRELRSFYTIEDTFFFSKLSSVMICFD